MMLSRVLLKVSFSSLTTNLSLLMFFVSILWMTIPRDRSELIGIPFWFCESSLVIFENILLLLFDCKLCLFVRNAEWMVDGEFNVVFMNYFEYLVEILVIIRPLAAVSLFLRDYLLSEALFLLIVLNFNDFTLFKSLIVCFLLLIEQYRWLVLPVTGLGLLKCGWTYWKILVPDLISKVVFSLLEPGATENGLLVDDGLDEI